MRKTIRKKMLLLTIMLLVTLGALSVNMTSVSAVESPYIAVDPPKIEDPNGTISTFTVDIITDYTGIDIWAYQLTLVYDPTIIQGVEVINGNLITNDTFTHLPPWMWPARFFPGEFDNTLGYLPLTLAYFDDSPPSTVSGPGTLATVTFNVVGTGTTDITLEYQTQLKAPSYDIVNALFDPNQIGHGYFDNTGGVTPTDPPVASFTWSPATATVGEPVDFDGSGSDDPDGFIVSYEWDFGNGNTSTGLEPTNVYTTEGTYIVELTVTDNDGLTATATGTIEVKLPLMLDLIKWKLKPEHHHFDISKDEDAYCSLTANVRNDYAVNKVVTLVFSVINKATNEIETFAVTDTVYSGTDKLVTCSDWIPSPGRYRISVQGTFDDGTTSTKLTNVSAVP